MSFQAVTWAIEQRAGSPSAKATLWSIANYANENWCAWPSQKTICEESEQSPDAVQKRLPALEDAGLVRRIPLRFAGRKTVDFCILAPSPFFNSALADIEPLLPRGCSIDPKFVAANPGNGTTEDSEEASAESDDDAAANPGNGNCGQSASTLPQTLPRLAAHAAALERQQEPESEPKNLERETRARDDKRPTLKRFLLSWPTAAIDDKSKTERAWNALPDEDCEPALAGIERFIAELKKHGRKHIPAGWKYLEDQSWKMIDAPAGQNPTSVQFNCWSKEWWALLVTKIERNEKTTFMVKYASESGRRGWGGTVAEMPTAERVAEFKNHPSDGPVMAAWRPWFESKGVKLPQWHQRVWVFLPSTDPPNTS